MPTTHECCNGTYTRDPSGVWRYPWGDEVPGAQDLTRGMVARLGLDGVAGEGIALDPRAGASGGAMPSGAAHDGPAVSSRDGNGSGHEVVGMMAPELMAGLMLTVADIGDVAGVTKATIDSYRYRGYLPEPQIVRARTPLWARPIIGRWLDERPGCGWRTDVYGQRRGAIRSMPVTGAGRMTRVQS